MKKSEMKGKVFLPAIAVLMVALILGGLVSIGHPGNAQLVLSDSAQVYLVPQDSGRPFCETVPVEIRVNATGFQAGQIKLIYNPGCADVTNWEPNLDDFPLGGWESDTPGEEWITFTALQALSGDYLIGTLTIHCISEEACLTALDFIEDPATGSALFDSLGSVIPATWTDGTFQCSEDKPDLVITEINCDRENDRVGYLVKNIGGAVAPAGHYATLWVNDEEVCHDEVVVDLGPEDTYEGWFDCYIWPESQTIDVRVCADNYQTVEESNEDNNCQEGLCSCNEVYFYPQHSRAVPGTSTEVEIRANAADFMGGQIKFVYNPACANVTNWERNEGDFPLGTWESGTPGEEWITFAAMEAVSGDYLIGTLTIHCLSEEECATALDFIEGTTDSALFDDGGNELPATWTDGTIECIGLCGDVAPCPDCDYTVNMGDVILLLSYVGHPGQYELCCEFCGDVAPCPDSDDTINMGDVILLLSYVGHPGQYELCCG